MTNNCRIIIVLPAYHAAKTLAQTVVDIPRDVVDDIILVDDCSRDDTVQVARSLGLHVIIHHRNKGYGGNQKTCYAVALARGADVVVMVHPDHQYDPRYITELVTPIAFGQTDAMFGSRMLTPGGAITGGMPRWKYLANVVLTYVANLLLGMHLSEYHSGFRAYSRRVLERISFDYNSDNFVFDTEIIVQLKHAGFTIREIAIPTRYFKDASSIGFRKSVEYGLQVCLTLWQYVLHRSHLVTDQRFNVAAEEA